MAETKKNKVVQGYKVYVLTNDYETEKAKKILYDKYAPYLTDAEMQKNVGNIEVNTIAIDFELPNYSATTISAAVEEIGKIHLTMQGGEKGVYFGGDAMLKNQVEDKETPRTMIYTAKFDDPIVGQSFTIETNYGPGENEDEPPRGIEIYKFVGWNDDAMDIQVYTRFLEGGDSFLWSFVDWVRNYIGGVIYDMYQQQSTLNDNVNSQAERLSELDNRVTALENEKS